MRAKLALFLIMFAGLEAAGEQQIDCGPDGVRTVPLAGGGVRSVCIAPTPPPLTRPTFTSATATPASLPAGGGSVTLAWTLAGDPPTTQTLEPGIGTIPATTRTRVVQVTQTTRFTVLASNAAGASTAPIDVTVASAPTSRTWGTVDPLVLGDFTAAEHDAWSVDGGDTWRYRLWHPQCPVIQNGQLKCFAHEHGDDPSTQRNTWVAANWDGRMGYAARRYTHAPNEPGGHDEAHEGYKVFIANIGDINGEGRVNRTASTSMPHFGTFRTGRFNIAEHSVSLTEEQPATNYRASFHLMADTGGTAAVCDPRAGAPVKDVIRLGSCLLNSSYEIWSMKARVRDGATLLMDQLITPAAFDPISAFNPANPTEPVLIAPKTDPRVQALKRFPGQDWTGYKGCSRESYVILPRLETAGRQTDVYFTDASGNVVPANTPNAIRVFLQRGLSGVPPNSSDIEQFKMRVDYCDGQEQWATAEGWRPRAGLAGKVSYQKLGFRN